MVMSNGGIILTEEEGEPKNSNKNPNHRHFVHHKSHIDDPGVGTDPTRWEAGRQMPEQFIEHCIQIIEIYSMGKLQNFSLLSLVIHNAITRLYKVFWTDWLKSNIYHAR